MYSITATNTDSSISTRNNTTFADLPDDVLRITAGFLEPICLVRLDQVNRQWHHVLSDDKLWKAQLAHILCPSTIHGYEQDNTTNRQTVCTRLAVRHTEQERKDVGCVFDALAIENGNNTNRIVGRRRGFMRMLHGSNNPTFEHNHYRGDSLAALVWIVQQNCIIILGRSFSIKCRICDPEEGIPQLEPDDIQFYLNEICSSRFWASSKSTSQDVLPTCVDGDHFNEIRDGIVLKLCRRAGIPVLRHNNSNIYSFIWRELVIRMLYKLLNQCTISDRLPYTSMPVCLPRPHALCMRSVGPPYDAGNAKTVIPRDVIAAARILNLPFNNVYIGEDDWYADTAIIPGEIDKADVITMEIASEMRKYELFTPQDDAEPPWNTDYECDSVMELSDDPYDTDTDDEMT